MNCANHTDVPAAAYCRTCGKALCASCTRDVQGTVYCESCLAARLNPPFVPRPGVGTMPPPPPVAGTSPGLALFLGFIPGVGAMYNGQFVKGIVHAMIFACCISAADHLGVIGAFSIVAWLSYMVFDAYSTAKARLYGQPLPDPLGFNKMFSANDPYVAQHMAATGEVIGQTMEDTVARARENWARHQAATNPNYAAPTPEQQQAYADNLRANIVNDANASAYVPVEPPPPSNAAPTGAVILIVIGVLFLLGSLDVFHFEMHRFWPVVLIGIGVWIFIKRTRTVGQ